MDKTKLTEIAINQIDDFPNHPFKVTDDIQMVELTESIKKSGLLLPVLIRPKKGGRYEMISGHRRMRASELAGNKTIKAIVCDYDDDTAAIVMVESNIHQRENMLPSEKAFAYKILYDAMKHQGKRQDKTCAPPGHKSRDDLSEKIGESREQIRRYIRLTELVPELLEFMDEGKMAMRPAVELSYLDEESQRELVDFIDENLVFPSHDQAIRMRKIFENGTLDKRKIRRIMSEAKPNQVEKYSFRADKINNLIPSSVPYAKKEEYVYKALEYYTRYLQKQKGRDAR
ncbi:MAG: ParB/RepB/Spo0J family partition protein [Clostridia bacterium]|nr:ParB/RepB/Spo0J family partition protein [Clostridia bacterium]